MSESEGQYSPGLLSGLVYGLLLAPVVLIQIAQVLPESFSWFRSWFRSGPHPSVEIGKKIGLVLALGVYAGLFIQYLFTRG